jgi:hypothetical protein
MKDITDYGHLEPGQVALSLADGEYVEECLGGMFVSAVTGIDDRALGYVGQQARGTGRGMANDYGIGRHRGQVAGRIDQGLTLRQARALGRYVDGIGR